MDKKESILEKELKKLEKIGVREISKATHIQEEHIESILNQNYENLLDCNANGFVKILERDYGVDLSEWLEEFNKIKSETKKLKIPLVCAKRSVSCVYCEYCKVFNLNQEFSCSSYAE